MAEQLAIADESNLDVRYWKILSYILGSRTIECDYKKANELLLAADTPKEPRFYFLSGLLYLLGKPNSLEKALVCFTRACVNPTKEYWYYLGVCQHKIAEEHKVPDDNKYASDKRTKELLSHYLTLLTNAYASFYNAYKLGSVEALLGMAECDSASERFRYNPALNAVIQQVIDQKIIYNFQCAEKAAQMGYAEGWEMANGWETRRIKKTIPDIGALSTISSDIISSVWSEERNISLAYYLSQRYSQEDALPHYIAGVAYECGIYGMASDCSLAKKEFESAAFAVTDVLGFIKDLANEHLNHVCSVRGYENNFHDFANSRLFPRECLLFYQYMIEHFECKIIPAEERKKRAFVWWYKLRYAMELSSGNEVEKGKLLIETRSPNAIFIMANLSRSLYVTPLKTLSRARSENYMKWLRLATETGSGSPEAEYDLAFAWTCQKTCDDKHRYLGHDNWYRTPDEKYDNHIVTHLKVAAEWGHPKARFALLMAARYGCVNTCRMSPESIAMGFKDLKDRGLREARYEYAFCEYDGLLPTRDEDFESDIDAAAFANYGRARTIHAKLYGSTYWEDIDRGCQER